MYRSIKTKAQLKRLPIGTKLILVSRRGGLLSAQVLESAKLRTIKEVRSTHIIFSTDVGVDAFLSLGGVKLMTTETGFKLIDKDTGLDCIEYNVLSN